MAKTRYGNARKHARSIPEEIRTVESAQLRCPKGHQLPHRTDRGNCTPVYCPDQEERPIEVHNRLVPQRVHGVRAAAEIRKAKDKAFRRVNLEADAIIDQMIPGDSPAMVAARKAAKVQKVEEMVRLGHSIGRFAAMRAFFKTPEGLEGAAAEEFVAKRALALSVDALMILEKNLKLGDSSEQREAARDILDMTGQRRKEAVNVGTAPIIMLINPGGGPVAVPWAQKIEIPKPQQPIGALPVLPTPQRP